MDSKRQSSDKNPYFQVQASWGMTKHMGGLKATGKLIELCRVERDNRVLVVGCGTGVSACYLAKNYGCRVTGVDLLAAMVDRSIARAGKAGLDKRVEFRTADAQELPFDDNSFNAVICESVNAFVPDKPRAINEYRRVIKPGGYLGINEVTWLRTPPEDLAAYLSRIMDAEFRDGSGWKGLLESSGLQEITAAIYKTGAIEQWTEEVRQIEFLEFVKAWCGYFQMLLTDHAARKFTWEAISVPRSIFGLFEYFGYGLYSGLKR
ncbi:MAG: class I SAM-dependent methyltransferase [Dehalococcoidales bacterium]|nr:class I SAM-dependent methyltransferase [Dehalococcoidales bacterium]